MMKDAVQSMKEKEFQSPRKFKTRRRQLRELDSTQSNLLDKTVAIGTTTHFDRTSKLAPESNEMADNELSTSDESEEDDGEDLEEEDKFDSNDPKFTFVTEFGSVPVPIATTPVQPTPPTVTSEKALKGLKTATMSHTNKVSVMNVSQYQPRKRRELSDNQIEKFLELIKAKKRWSKTPTKLDNDLAYVHNYEQQLQTILKKNGEVMQ
jgi:hypothetical protein